MHRAWIIALLLPAAAPGTEPVDLFAKRGSWRAIKVNDFVQHGEVAFKDGELRLGAGQPGTGVRWTGKKPAGNFEISLEAKRVEGFDFFCGLTFPAGKQYLTLVLGGWDGEVCGLSNIDALNASENETRFTHRFAQNRWYKVRLRVEVARIRVWLDGKQVVDFKPEGKTLSLHRAMEPARPLGMATWHTAARIRKATLKRIAQEP